MTTKRFHRAMGFAVAAGCAALLVFATVREFQHHRDSRPTVSGRVNGNVQFPASHGPFASGTRISLAAAADDAGFNAYRPDSPLASDANLTTVWFSSQPSDGPEGRVNQLAFEYSSGIEVIVKHAIYPDAGKFFAASVIDMGLPSTALSQIGGQPALVIPPNTNGTGGPAAVVINRNGIEIALYSDKRSDADLIEAANSVK